MLHPSSRLARPRPSHPTTLALGAVLILLVSGCGPESDAGEDGGTDAPSAEAWAAADPAGAEDLGEADDADEGDDAEAGGESGRVQAGEVRLRLETRDGRASEGWSLTEGAVVDAEEADLLLSSWDCGARGRWVQLEAQGVDLCDATVDGEVDLERCASRLEVGGSDPEVPLGGAFFVVTPAEVVRVVLVDRTETPFEWYLEDDLSFEVLLAIEPDDAP